MLDKSKFIYRIIALLFTGAITAASLIGCGYGTQHVPRQTVQEKKVQQEQSSSKDAQISESQTDKTNSSK